MKFNHALQLNSVPEWSEFYIDYSRLKEFILRVERLLFNALQTENSVHENENEEDCAWDGRDDIDEREINRRNRSKSTFSTTRKSPLRKRLLSWNPGDHSKSRQIHETVNPSPENESAFLHDIVEKAKGTFTAELDGELEKIEKFYKERSSEFQTEMEQIRSESILELQANQVSTAISGEQTPLLATHIEFVEKSSDESLRKRIVSLYINFSNLKDFLEINHTGFSKILKKFDKLTNAGLKSGYLEKVDSAFRSLLQDNTLVSDAIVDLENTYAHVFCQGDKEAAILKLKQKLKDHVVYERNTVWRDMVEMERKTMPSAMVVQTAADSIAIESRRSSFWKLYRCPILISTFILIFGLLVSIPVLENRIQNNCLAIFVLASLFWSSEVIPLFVTSILVPLLVIVFKSIPVQQPDNAADVIAKHVFSVMFSPTIMLLLGGFSIAAALSKYNIAKSMAISVLSRTGKNPSHVLLAIMAVATFCSMWISNVAAPVLCFSIIQPILRNLPSDHPFAKCLILGIALASNVGGMTSPIASPQNVIAIQNMTNVDWLKWLGVSIPVCIVCDISVWLYLLFVFNPSKKLKEVLPIRKSQENWTRSQIIVLVTSGITIGLWCLNTALLNVFGNMGTTGLIPMVVFFATGLLSKEDLNNFPWTVVFLAMGGSVLGDSVNQSGLLALIAGNIKNAIQGYQLYAILVVFCGIILVITTFISHTVGAMVIVPVVSEVGKSLLPVPHPDLLIMAAALMCSGAMGLPVSGFPNMAAMAVEDVVTGKPYLKMRDFLVGGVPSSIIAFIIIITLGYGLMTLLSFQ